MGRNDRSTVLRSETHPAATGAPGRPLWSFDPMGGPVFHVFWANAPQKATVRGNRLCRRQCSFPPRCREEDSGWHRHCKKTMRREQRRGQTPSARALNALCASSRVGRQSEREKPSKAGVSPQPSESMRVPPAMRSSTWITRSSQPGWGFSGCIGTGLSFASIFMESSAPRDLR